MLNNGQNTAVARPGQIGDHPSEKSTGENRPRHNSRSERLWQMFFFGYAPDTVFIDYWNYGKTTREKKTANGE